MVEEERYGIFISYRRAHSHKVEHVYEELYKKFENVFFDQEEIHTGEVFERKILSALAISDLFLLVLTKEICDEFKSRKNTSDWLTKEILFANKNDIPILPVFLYDEEYAREINLLIKKDLEKCVPEEISFLPNKQFFKIRLERKARKNDLIGLADEITLALKKKKIINTIQERDDTSHKEIKDTNNLNPEVSEKNRSRSFIYKMLIVVGAFFLGIAGYFGYMKYSKQEVTVYDIPPQKTRDDKSNEKFTTNEDPDNISTLDVSNNLGENTQWKNFTYINAGDKLAFNIHYYGWHKGLNDLRVSIDDLDGKVFSANDILAIKAAVSAKNLKPSYGEVNISFNEPVKLKLNHISWQKNKCQSFKCETTFPENPENIFTEKGLYLGDLIARDNDDYFGNIIVVYDAIKEEMSQNITTNQGKIKTLLVTNKRGSNKRWFSSIHIDSSEILSFDLHYNLKYQAAKNLQAYIENLNGKTFKEGEKIKVQGKITSDTLDASRGEAEVIFDEDVKLLFHKVSWQKWPCQAVKCESLIEDNINNLFNGSGLFLGDIRQNDDHWSGNLIVEYKAIKKKETIEKTIDIDTVPIRSTESSKNKNLKASGEKDMQSPKDENNTNFLEMFTKEHPEYKI